jgi:eukaryotic-like serine/threonine-protein kinase
VSHRIPLDRPGPVREESVDALPSDEPPRSGRMAERAPPRPPGHRRSGTSGTRSAVLPIPTSSVESSTTPGHQDDEAGASAPVPHRDDGSDERPSSDVVLPLVNERTPHPSSVAPADPSASVGGAHEIRPGKIIDGRYQVERLLGSGAVGLVYQCRHLILDKPVAIKVLRPDFARDAEVSERLVVEAKAASAIGSPHIVETVDFGALPDGSAYFVMEYLEGLSLAELIEGGPMGPEEVLHIGLQLASALGEAHARGIVHRDLKPDNVFIVTRGSDSRFVKVLDFGIAKLARAERRLTRTGQVYGTPHYMAPEQASGKQTDPRTDVYALGVILFEMVTRRVPFDADEPMGILLQHLHDPPPPIEAVKPADAPDLPGLERVVQKCLAKEASHRYASMSAVAIDLRRLTMGLEPEATLPPPSSAPYRVTASSPPSPAVARGLLLLAVLGVGVSAVLGYALYLRSADPITTSLPSRGQGTAAPLALDREPVVHEAAEPEGDERGEPVMVIVIPQDARITRGQEDLGPMPVTVHVPPGERVHLSVRRSGFVSRRLALDGSRSQVVVGLVPIDRSSSKAEAPTLTEDEADEAARESVGDGPSAAAAGTEESAAQRPRADIDPNDTPSPSRSEP